MGWEGRVARDARSRGSGIEEAPALGCCPYLYRWGPHIRQCVVQPHAVKLGRRHEHTGKLTDMQQTTEPRDLHCHYVVQNVVRKQDAHVGSP